MQTRNGVLLSVGLLAVGISAWQLASSARADATMEASRAANTLAVTMLADGEESGYAFVGAKKCKKCHIKQFKSWDKGVHGTAFDILKPGNNAEAKTKHGLDPAKDYTTDEKCVKCHVTGLGKAGGYEIGGDEKKMKDLVGAGCETCHGAGEKYIELHEEIMKAKRQYESSEMYAVGMTKVDVDTCKQCHNEESPTFDAAKSFDYEERVKEGVHEHFDLELRKE